MSVSAPRSLIVGPSWVGDMVMAQVLFRLLKAAQPEVAIDVLAPDWSRPLLERMPEVDRALSLPFGHGELRLADRYRQGKALRDQGYEQAFVLPNSLKSALLPAFARIPVRTGWRGELRYGWLNDLRPLDKARYPLMIERFAALAFPEGMPLPEPLPWPQLAVSPQSVAAALERLGLNTAQPVLALCPGAEFGPAKRWPERHYTTVARYFQAYGWQVWLFGSAKDKAVAEAIKNGAGRDCRVLTGDTSLAEAIDLLAQANLVVSNDSGLMHIAAATGRRLIVPYGSSSPDFTPPLSKTVRVLRLGLECSPCFQRECPLKHLNCLEQLEPGMVITAARELLEEPLSLARELSVNSEPQS
ncbi:MAG: lipopolysaccharide heptosyltransferase II [Gammaproteobacteria bacterium]|nr:lipopolysaccharide heptosyltransferase II [Gammaproteobacteria bacterium]